jgi:hypothetical protein
VMSTFAAHFALVALAIVTVACDSSSSTSPTTSPITNSSRLSGTVPAAVNGVPQSVFSNFTVGQGGGMVTLTLTSAVETFPDGTLNHDVVVGLAVGTPTGATCTLPAGSTPALFQAGAMPSMSGALNAGAYCVQVSDQTVQPGPAAYTVVVASP